MGWDYRIIAPSEAAALIESPGDHVCRTPLGNFRKIYDWITSRAGEWHRRDGDHLTVTIGEDGHVVLHLVTVRWHEMVAEALRERDHTTAAPDDFVARAMKSYVPRDDEDVIEIDVDGRGTGDITLIAQCAAWLNAAVFDCQLSEMLTPEQWLRRSGNSAISPGQS